MKARAMIAVSLTLSAATFGEDINLTNRVATFTNLEGRLFTSVQLVRADADGIIYRMPEGTGGGRVSYTNLAPGLLQSFGIPTNLIAAARARAVHRAVVDAAERQRHQELARREVLAADIQRRLHKIETVVNGRVAQVSPAGLLVSCPVVGPYYLHAGIDHYVTALVSDYPKPAADGDPISIGGSLMDFDPVSNQMLTRSNTIHCYYVGLYTLGSSTVRHYTCDARKAAEYLRKEPDAVAPDL
jgi:hypothetical protein